MLTFTKDFFKEEIRSDFKVESSIKHMWAAKLELLAKVDDICKKYNIQYFAEWGTLLGAVRHNGFIPWDDDIDIAMKRPDYNRFLEVCTKEFVCFDDNKDTDIKTLGDNFLFSNIYTAKVHTHIQAVLLSSNKVLIFDDNYLKRFHGYPVGVGIDIFPLDYLPEKGENTDQLFELIRYIETIQYNDEHWTENGFPNSEEAKNYILNIESACNIKLDWNMPIRIQLLRLMDSLYSYFSEEESTYLMPLYWQSSFPDRTLYHKKEWFDETILLPFENIMIPVPKEYDKVLTNCYHDYMTPSNWVGNHINNNLINLVNSLNMDPAEAINNINKIMMAYE